MSRRTKQCKDFGGGRPERLITAVLVREKACVVVEGREALQDPTKHAPMSSDLSDGLLGVTRAALEPHCSVP